MKVIAGKIFVKEEATSVEYNPVFGTTKVCEVADAKAYWWKCDLKNIKVGDFAIVENRDTYTMVEVIAVADIDEENARLVCGRKPCKKVIAKVDRNTLDALANGKKIDEAVITIPAPDKKKAKTTKK